MTCGHNPRRAGDVHRHCRDISRGAASVAGRHGAIRGAPVQPQGVVTHKPAGGRASGEPQVGHLVGYSRGELGGLLITLLCLRRSASDEQQSSELSGQLGRLRPSRHVAGRPYERGTKVVDDPIEPDAPGLVDVGGFGRAKRSDGQAAPLLVAGLDLVQLACVV